jgi:antitoxin HicB
MRYQYAIVLERNEEGGYTVTVPALKGCITEGDTLTEAIANAQEAIACYLESLHSTRRARPARCLFH